MTNKPIDELKIVNFDVLEEQRKHNPGAPWKKARTLQEQRAAEFITAQDIYNKLSHFNNIRDKCLYVLMYITACRVGEIVRRRVWKIGKKMVRIVKKGKVKNALIQDFTKKKLVKIEYSITKDDLTIQELGAKKILVVRLRNLKNKQKGGNTKLIPLPLTTPLNLEFFKIIQQYTRILDEGEELFPIGERRAEQIINKAGFNPHFLRSCRLTHLVKYNNFSDQKLKVFAGWSDSRPSKHYIKIGWEDMANSMN